MIYRYTAYSADKRMVTGSIESTSLEMAEDSLYRAGYNRIIKLQQSGGNKIDFKKMAFGKPKVSRQALLDFTNELAILLESGLTLLMGLKQLERQSGGGALKPIVADVSSDLQGGTPFHKALLKHPDVFNETYTAMIEANEKAGTLDAGLRQIAKEIKSQIEMRSQIQRAVTMPGIIVVLAIAVVLLMVIVVLPPLVEVFRSFGANLPITTRILIAFSDFINNNVLAIVVILVAIVVAGVVIFKHPKTKQAMDRYMLRAPLIGSVLIWHNTARFTRTMSNLLRAGILLPDTINILLRSINNTYFREALTEIRKQLVQGQALSSAIAKNPVFPQLMVEMTAVGESSGELEASLSMLADYFETKTERRIQRLTALLEPALMLAMGLVVGVIAVSMFSTIYGLVGSLGN
jgi:type IV pilus assembly protein PilC